MIRNHNSREEENGAVTIEATIALTAFLFLFLMIYSIISICRAQAKIQIGLNNVAKEISQYSYLYGLTGLDESMAKFQEAGNQAKSGVNSFIDNTITVFEDIQNLGGSASTLFDGDAQTILNNAENISNELKSAYGDYSKVKKQIGDAAKDPVHFMFSMVKLLGSETWELAKSHVIAEPVTRALIQKHLIRNKNDNANAFCKSVGIVKGSYLGEESYFNGIDFSHSTLFPYGSEEITLVAAYKVRLLQLIPIDVELSITQSASTKGWLHGDHTQNSAAKIVSKSSYSSPDQSVWNSQTMDKRNQSIRSEELNKLKEQGYSGVSGETYLQAYNPETNTFAMVAISNQIYNSGSVDKIDRKAVEEDIKRQVAEINSATDNKKTVKVKNTAENGNITVEEVDLSSKGTVKQKIILVVPEDAGVKEYYEQVIKDLGYEEIYEVHSDYGTGMKREEEKPSGKEGGN